MNIEQIVGTVAGIFTALAMLPQLFKILREKKSEDVSGWMLIVLLIGLALWVVYGCLKQDLPIIITNAFSVALNLILAFFRHKYKEK